MTSRVEAVARAIDPAAWKIIDQLRSDDFPLPTVVFKSITGKNATGLLDAPSKEKAQAAIAANDAWLKADRRAKDKAVLKAEYPTTPRRPDK